MNGEHAGNGGYGGGIFGRLPPQMEQIRGRTEWDEIGAADARGGRVILLNIMLVLAAFVAVVLLGPLFVVLVVIAAILFVAYKTNQIDFSMYPFPIEINPYVFIWACAGVGIMLWLIIVDCAWDTITAWYPFHIILPWWGNMLAWAILGAIGYGLLDLRESHRRSLYNENWPPTFQAMPPDVGPYFAGEYSVNAPDDETREEIMGMLKEAIDRQVPIEVPRPVPYHTRNGNNELTKPTTQVLSTVPESFVSPTRARVLWSEFVEFFTDGLKVGITTSVWQTRRKWGKPYIAAMQRTLEMMGYAEHGGEGSPYKLTVNKPEEVSDALTIIRTALFPNPPTLPQTVQTENSAPVDGRTVENTDGRSNVIE